MTKINVKLIMKIKMIKLFSVFIIFCLVFTFPAFAQEAPPITSPTQIVSSSGTPFNVGWNYFTVSAGECTLKNVFNELQAAGGGALLVSEIWKEENGGWKMFNLSDSSNVKVSSDNIFAFNSNQKFYLSIAPDACKIKNTNRDAQIQQVRDASTKQNGDSFLEKLLSVPGDFWSGILGKMEVNKQPDLSSNVNSSSQTAVFNTLNVLGKATLTDLGITGKITQGLLSINGLDSSFATINTLSNDLYLQNQLLGGINILNGKVLIDKDGNVKIDGGSLTVKGSSVGNAILPAGTTTLDITTSAATPTSKIFITANNKTGKQSILVTNKSAGKFTVSIEDPYPQDIPFDWWVIGTQ